MLLEDGANNKTDISKITNEEINSHVSITCDGIENVVKSNVRWCAMGDSITDGYVSYYDEETGENKSELIQEKGWAFKLAEQKQWNVDNMAVGGTGYLFDADMGKSAWQVAQDIDFNDYDLVTLAYGINDWNTLRAIGSKDDEFDFNKKPTTIYGAMRKTIETIIQSNPLCKIVVITPLNCWWRGTEQTNWAIGASNEIGYTLEDLFNVIVEICKYYGIEYIDMTHNSIINRKNIKDCLLDEVHPTEQTHTIIAHELAAKIPFN